MEKDSSPSKCAFQAAIAIAVRPPAAFICSLAGVAVCVRSSRCYRGLDDCHNPWHWLASCEDGVHQAKRYAISSATLDARSKRSVPPGPAPAGMVWIPAGEFWMGSDRTGSSLMLRPWHRVQLGGYWIDKEVVTNAQFARFVAATHYVTGSRGSGPRAEDFPNASPELLVAGSVVFTPPLRILFPWTTVCNGGATTGRQLASPEGPASDIKGPKLPRRPHRLGHACLRQMGRQALAH